MALVPYLKLARFPLVFTAVADSAAGYLLALPEGAAIRPPALGLAAAVSALFYASGMVYNDIADQLRDRVLHPERPLPSKQVTAAAAQSFAKAMLLIAVSACCVFGLPAAGWGLALGIGLLTYNFLLKHRRWAGSVNMALVRMLNLGIGAFAAAHLAPGSMSPPPLASFPWIAMGTLGLYVLCLTLVSTWEDEKGATGWRVGLAAAGMAAAPLLTMLRAGDGLHGFGALASLWILPWALMASANPTRERLIRLVRWGVLGIIVLEASQVAVTGRGREAAWIGALLVPALLLLPVFRRL